jgi:hypothetical protein
VLDCRGEQKNLVAGGEVPGKDAVLAKGFCDRELGIAGLKGGEQALDRGWPIVEALSEPDVVLSGRMSGG